MSKDSIKLPFTKFNIYIVGAGGTGGNLCPLISRLVSERNDVSIMIIDGDTIEASNLERQPYLKNEIGKNKASVLAGKLNAAFGVEVKFFPEYITTSKQLMELIEFEDCSKRVINIVVGAVDNHNARICMEHVFFKSESLIYIDSANEDLYGEVILGAKFYNSVIQKSRGMYRPLEIFKGTRRVKNRSCEIKVNLNPQYFPTNQFASNIILKMLSDIIIEKKIFSRFVVFDTELYKMSDVIIGEEEKSEENYELYMSQLTSE